MITRTVNGHKFELAHVDDGLNLFLYKVFHDALFIGSIRAVPSGIECLSYTLLGTEDDSYSAPCGTWDRIETAGAGLMELLQDFRDGRTMNSEDE